LRVALPAPPREYLDRLLHQLVERTASDLHLKVGEPPVMRVHGDLYRTDFPVLTPEDTRDILYAIMSQERRERFEEMLELDMAYAIADLARFRVNVFRQRGALGAVLRLIPIRVQTIDELGLPPVLKQVAMLPRGLVLVTGPTGSGKSTTLAAMINHINQNKSTHVVTIEDPIEFTHQDQVSAITQRELGIDSHSFADALRHVMRQNPDIILVGEMRDLETISLALTAAETGHLVLSTVHTTDAPQTVDRIIDVFEPERQQQIRTQLAVTLQAVISQTLLHRSDVEGRIAAFEIMLVTSGIRNLIREKKTHQMYSMIQTGTDIGMQSLDGHLLQLVKDRVVAFEDAMGKSSNPGEFRQRAANLGAIAAASVAGPGSGE
jgi:twitching motility protein PilT